MFRKEGSAFASTGKSSSAKKETPLRRSDMRRLRDRFLEGLAKDEVTLESEIAEIVNDAFGCGTSNEILLRRKLRMNDENVTIYSRSPSSSQSSDTATADNDKCDKCNKWPYNRTSQPLLLEMEDSRRRPILIPCLSLLSIVPHCLPTVLIHSETSKYICRGADLMRGGVIYLPPGQTRGTVVSIMVYKNPQPFAVGILAEDVDRMEIGYGNKGMAVKLLHTYGDDLWKSQCPDATQKTLHNNNNNNQNTDDGHYNNPGFHNGEKILPILGQDNLNDDHDDDDEEDVNDEAVWGEDEDEKEEGQQRADTGAKNTVSDAEGQETTENDVDKDADDTLPEITNLNIETTEQPQENTEEEEEEEMTEQEKNEALLLNCFYKAIILPSDPPIKCPLPVSVFYAKHILAARPAGTTLEMKQTRYKKIGAFLEEQAKLGIISIAPSKDKKDKVAFLSDIHKSHPLFRQAKRELKQEQESSNDTSTTATTASTSKKTKLAVVNLYCIPAHFVPLLRLNKDHVSATNAKSEARRGTGFLTTPECGEILNQYIASENLIVDYDPSEVTLDGPLCDALYKKSKKEKDTNAGIAAPQGGYPTQVSRKDLMEKWMDKMEKAFAIVKMPGNEILSMKRGKPSKVLITVTRGSGGRNRFVTRVRGLEEYNINGLDFSKDVSKRFASSGAIDNNPEKSAALKKGCVEVVFGGHLLEELMALLTANEKLTSHGGAKNSPYCVPKGAIEVKLGKGITKKKKK